MKPLLASISFFLLGCAILFPLGRAPTQMYEFFSEDISSNGARIYFSGKTSEGKTVSFSGGPIGGMMMNQKLSCATCHGKDGSGGVHIMHMQVMDAPDIRFAALEEENHQGESSEEHSSEPHEVYDLQTFKRAVVYGEHPDGESLSRDMPRWQLSDSDIEDLFEFIAALDD